MISLQITSLKGFMAGMLTSDLFDDFLLEEATIDTLNTFSMDGHINHEFFSSEEPYPYEFRVFSDVKGLFFDLIKGKRTPLSFKFVLTFKPEKCEELFADKDIDFGFIKDLVLCVKFDGTFASVTTGTSYNTFVLDKTADRIWDEYVRVFLFEQGIHYEEM